MKKVARFIFAWTISPLIPPFSIMSILFGWLLEDDFNIKEEFNSDNKFSLVTSLRAWFKWASLRG